MLVPPPLCSRVRLLDRAPYRRSTLPGSPWPPDPRRTSTVASSRPRVGGDPRPPRRAADHRLRPWAAMGRRSHRLRSRDRCSRGHRAGRGRYRLVMTSSGWLPRGRGCARSRAVGSPRSSTARRSAPSAPVRWAVLPLN